MKFLVDNNLSPTLNNLLCELGYDSKHVKELNLESASDHKIKDEILNGSIIVIEPSRLRIRKLPF